MPSSKSLLVKNWCMFGWGINRPVSVICTFFFEIIPRLGNFRPIILLESRACDNMGNGSIEYLCMCVSRGGGEEDIYSDGIMGSDKNAIKFHKCPSLLKTVSDTMSFVRPLLALFID